MTQTRTVMTQGLISEYERFEELIRSLSDAEWDAPSRCAGWSVGDVARHVVGLLADVFTGQAGIRAPEEQVADRAGRSRQEVADELASLRPQGVALLSSISDDAWEGPSPAPGVSIREGIEALWYDAWLHADDMRAPTGRVADVRSDVLEASVRHIADELAKQDWGPGTIALDGLDKVQVGDGDGPTVTGDPYRFVLVSTGRADPAELGLDETINIYR